jgi:hypothetical protein
VGILRGDPGRCGNAGVGPGRPGLLGIVVHLRQQIVGDVWPSVADLDQPRPKNALKSMAGTAMPMPNMVTTAVREHLGHVAAACSHSSP